MIKNKEITFVVQGAIDKINTPLCLKSIRKNFKGAKILLSTWEGTDVNGLDFDEATFSKDPGGFKFSEKFYDNTNRQIVSSYNGLRKTKTIYACKIRSDIVIFSNKFIKYFDKYKKFSNNYRLYENRILTYIFSSKFFHEEEITPFHVSDWILFGKSDDLLKIFNIELIKEGECAYENGIFPKNVPLRFYKNPQKYFPEQYICYKALEKRYPSIGFCHRFCNAENIVKISNEHIANNYVILSDFQMPLFFIKKNRSEYCNVNFEYWSNSVNHFKWLDLYKKYCDNEFKYPNLKRKIYEKIIEYIYKSDKVRKIIETYSLKRSKKI